MRFMNEWDIMASCERWVGREEQRNLFAASLTLRNLANAVNANSDGWAYWSKPQRAAAKLIELIEGDGTYAAIRPDRVDITDAQLKAALRPIKAFRTRFGLTFEIVEG